MIHINQSSDKKYYVTVTAENGQVLSTSETLNSKQSAWKNIAAQLLNYSNPYGHVVVMDNIKKVKIRFNPHYNSKKEI